MRLTLTAAIAGSALAFAAACNQSNSTAPKVSGQTTSTQADTTPLTGDTRTDVRGERQPWDQPGIVGNTQTTSGDVDTNTNTTTNRSTTLGNGQSGMYTGGKGTYGGRATWGTGAGAER